MRSLIEHSGRTLHLRSAAREAFPSYMKAIVGEHTCPCSLGESRCYSPNILSGAKKSPLFLVRGEGRRIFHRSAFRVKFA
jgi:hypothetical protein